MRKKDVHRFLWPRNALGMPVRMRSAPRTAKPGSMWVSSLVKSGAVVEVADSAAELVLEAVEEGVIVTLNVVGTTVVVGMSRVPECNVVVIVVSAVVRESETDDGELVGEIEPEVLEPLGLVVVLCAKTGVAMRRAKRRHERTTAGQERGAGMAGLAGRRWPGGREESGNGREEEI